MGTLQEALADAGLDKFDRTDLLLAHTNANSGMINQPHRYAMNRINMDRFTDESIGAPQRAVPLVRRPDNPDDDPLVIAAMHKRTEDMLKELTPAEVDVLIAQMAAPRVEEWPSCGTCHMLIPARSRTCPDCE